MFKFIVCVIFQAWIGMLANTIDCIIISSFVSPPTETTLTLIVPRVWEIGYTQPCIKCRGKSATHFVYFWSRKTHHYTHLEATSYIPQQGQSLHIWTTSTFTTGCYKNKYTIQFLWMACISRFAAAILSGKTELALGTIRVKMSLLSPKHFHKTVILLWKYIWSKRWRYPHYRPWRHTEDVDARVHIYTATRKS